MYRTDIKREVQNPEKK